MACNRRQSFHSAQTRLTSTTLMRAHLLLKCQATHIARTTSQPRREAPRPDRFLRPLSVNPTMPLVRLRALTVQKLTLQTTFRSTRGHLNQSRSHRLRRTRAMGLDRAQRHLQLLDQEKAISLSMCAVKHEVVITSPQSAGVAPSRLLVQGAC